MSSSQELCSACWSFNASSISGAEEGPAEADQAWQGLRRGEEEAPEECEREARAGAGGDHSPGRGQGGAAVQYGPATGSVIIVSFVE